MSTLLPVQAANWSRASANCPRDAHCGQLLPGDAFPDDADSAFCGELIASYRF
jgi:hypothetical protein